MATIPSAPGSVNDIGTYQVNIEKPVDFTPAAVQAGGDIFGTLASIAYNELTYNRNKKMFYEQRAYNEPIAQMARLKQAGLNPNLVYGSGNAVHQSPQPAQASAVPVDLSAPAAVLNNYMEYKNQIADFSLKKAQLDLIHQRNLTEQQNTIMRELDNMLNSSTLGEQQLIRENKRKVLLQQLFNLEKDWEIKFQEESIKRKQRDWMEEGIPITGGDKFLQYYKFAQEQLKKHVK